MGYLPEGMNAYLMRLGWSPGHDDILSKEEAIPVFEIGQIGKAPSRLDFKKLDSVNAHFMALADDDRLTRLLIEHLEARATARLERGGKRCVGTSHFGAEKAGKDLAGLGRPGAFRAGAATAGA